MDKDAAKAELRVLVDRFNQILKKEGDIKSKEEEKTKKDLIRPLFERVLGWNFEEDVTAEEKISKGWVDYGFRMNDVPKFFLEAKALREDLDNPKFFQQAVSYAYYKHCAWAVLTNFETVKILNAEWEAPNYLYSHLMTIKCSEFLDRFDDLWLLSKESFEQGLLDRLAERFGKRTKRITFDRQLLDDFTRFRDMFSKNVAKLNQHRKLTEEELDESIQRILNRLIFIRNCEDKGLEEKKLWEAKNEARVWKKVKEAFAYYDKHYDSKLFTYDLTDPKKVHLCDTLDIDDGILREIIDGLYRTKDKSVSYDFSIIDADVLGTVYEQYLSHILRKTGRRAKLAENHMHRKEQGIYYTPTYIVDFIVRNTLGEMLKDKKVDVERIRVLDLSCGSGSFLIKAFDVLDEYYLKNYKEYSQTQLDFKINIPFKRKSMILQKNIFGVDLDRQAVEIAQLNLLIKIAEKGHLLPILEQNIKCGNSLIDDEKIAGDKAFKWEEEFKGVMRESGFDVVIGNPPYVNVETLPQDEKDFLKKYEVYAGKSDLLYYFYNKGISLLKPNGLFGFITSRYFLEATHAKNLRKYILENCEILKILDLSNLPVFKDVGIHTVILILKKTAHKPTGKNKIFYKDLSAIEQLRDHKGTLLKQSDFSENAWTVGTETGLMLFRKINTYKMETLGNISVIEQGQKSGLNSAFTVTKDTIKENKLEKEFIRKLVKNSYIKPYSIEDRGLYLIYASDEVNKDNAPNIISYLHKFQKDLEARAEACDGLYPWYRLQRPRSKELFDAKEKIIVPYRAERNQFGYDDQQRYNDGGDVRIIVMKNSEYPTKYVLAILNSKLMNFYYRFIGRKKGSMFEYFVEPLQKIPIAKANNPDREQLVNLVEKMLSINQRLSEIGDKMTDERAKIEDERKKTDFEIDELVYKIYGITGTEKKIIEST